VLKEAGATRDEENKAKDKGDQNDHVTEDNRKRAEEKQESKRPAMAKYSPLEPEILDLMYGHRDRKTENEVDAIKRKENVKKRRTP